MDDVLAALEGHPIHADQGPQAYHYSEIAAMQANIRDYLERAPGDLEAAVACP